MEITKSIFRDYDIRGESPNQINEEVVRKIGKIISSVQNAEFSIVETGDVNISKERLITNSICYHAALLADNIKASAICTLTNSGYTGWEISSYRPKSLVLVFTSNVRILSQLNLLWGVKCIFYDKLESTDKTGKSWFTIGVSQNIIEASFKALIDSLEYKLFKEKAPANLHEK